MYKLKSTIKKITPLNENAMKLARKRQDTLTKPRGSLGRLEELSIQIAGITRNAIPIIKEKRIITIAGDHGVVEEGVSTCPSKVTTQMIYNFINGSAGINVLSRHIGAKVIIVDMGAFSDIAHENLIVKKIKNGTNNIAKGPAMSREDAIYSIESGIEIFEEAYKNGLDIVGTGDMGIGNTTPSSAIVSAIIGAKVEEVTGRGTGLDDSGLKNKIEVIKTALKINQPDKNDGIDVLSKVGGFEIGGIAGVIIGAAAANVPVVIDGFISSAGALIASKIAPLSINYMISAHNSVEIGHNAIMKHLGLKPILDLNMRLGEGTGAALGIGIVEASVKLLGEMATFDEANVTEGKIHKINNAS
ncbi:MAG: nicotinate-nucleotide--dimethylbenzimidazole phosphoribosyltransferase [Methanosarcinaceae archaeon]|jgi:nicotinate-nucleotide--dimethylbenzimidazole phosphoribosyltransferase|nr:nicotinate-nucleotide--dimethylbenzimidazole phosphoribosyltransferase [Methanosarcinaceae archaeon]NKQ39336.1 nicotinate-nucleotide--dimethylbenzimidazole phosphoribosyltransferase [Methanosarcinales archaeon]